MKLIMHVEVFPGDGEWHKIGPMFESAISKDVITDRVYDGRDEILYEVLGYIGGSSFEHTEIKPIHALRGLPNDVSARISQKPYYGNGDFASYVTLSEILDYNWDEIFEKTGCVSEKMYIKYKDGALKSWPFEIDTHTPKKNSEIVTEDYMDAILDGTIVRDDNIKYFVRVKYGKHAIKDYCSFFYNVSIPELKGLVIGNMTSNDVRVVYAFVD